MTEVLFRSPLVDAVVAVAILVVVSSTFVVIGIAVAVSRLGKAVSSFLPIGKCAEAVEEWNFPGFVNTMADRNGIELWRMAFFDGNKDRILNVSY